MRVTHYCCESCGGLYDFVTVTRNPTTCPECAGRLREEENKKRKS